MGDFDAHAQANDFVFWGRFQWVITDVDFNSRGMSKQTDKQQGIAKLNSNWRYDRWAVGSVRLAEFKTTPKLNVSLKKKQPFRSIFHPPQKKNLN